MKHIAVLCLFLVFSLPGYIYGQKKKYITSGGEVIFSWASANKGGVDVNTITRFAPVFNIQTLFHYDPKEKLGFFTGLNLRNLGFIFDDPAIPGTRYKARTYTLGVPIAIKLGEMNGFFSFTGYELELPFAYKQKTFVNGEKTDKFTAWFSSRTPGLYQSLFVGVQTPLGIQLKFKYYLTNFFNKNYAGRDQNNNVYYPYKDFKANVFYFSISLQILRGTKFYYHHKEKKHRGDEV